MVVMEYKLSLLDDFRIGDTIMITNKTSSGWKAMINNKHEIVFEVSNDNFVPLLLDGWMLVDVNDRWEKMWVSCKENPFQVGFFKSEQEKLEKTKKDSLHMDNLLFIDELEVVQATNPQNPPIRFSFRTQSKRYNLIIPSKDGMVSTTRAIMKALKNKEKTIPKPAQPPASATSTSKPIQIPMQQPSPHHLSKSAPQTSPIHSHFQQQTQYQNNHAHTPHNLHPVPTNLSARDNLHPTQTQTHVKDNPTQTSTQQSNNHTQPPPATYHPPNQIQNQLATQLIMEKKVQIQAPPSSNGGGAGRSSPGPGQSQIGGAKWLTNIKNIVNPKANSTLNVMQKGKDDKKAQSVMMSKSQSFPDLPLHTRNTQNVSLAVRTSPTLQKAEPKPERKILTRVYWRDGTYHTVDVSSSITAKEVCEFCTKKTKVAIFENLFCLYECLVDGTERILDPKTNISELLLGWGEESENHLICDLNLGTKNTVKTQLRKTLAMESRDFDSDDSSDMDDTNDFGDLDDLDAEPSEEDESIAMMIQEMIKLKHQLQEEDEMIERLNVEEQEVDMLISRLANL